MKLIAIIPARSGSKGLKDKNIKKLSGVPLMGITINSAIKSRIFKKIVVSTDSKKYAEIANSFGASCEYLRDKSISEDSSTVYDLVKSVISNENEMGNKYTHACILQPTSPFRTSDHIIDAFNLFIDSGVDSLISVCKFDDSLKIINNLDKNHSMYEFIKGDINIFRQNNKMYKINGAIYLFDIGIYLEKRTFYTQNSKAYIMDKKSSVDIDDSMDFLFAEFLISENNV